MVCTHEKTNEPTSLKEKKKKKEGTGLSINMPSLPNFFEKLKKVKGGEASLILLGGKCNVPKFDGE